MLHYGIAHEEYGEGLAATIEARAGHALETQTVQGYLCERMAGYKVPREVTFHAGLPREDSDKIFKFRSKAAYWEAQGRRI